MPEKRVRSPEKRARYLKLRQDYVDFLKQHGLEPRAVPPGAEKLREMVFKMHLESALRAGEIETAEMYRQIERTRQNSADLDRDPTELLLEGLMDEVEKNVLANEKFAPQFHHNVYVGEFPTGSFNAQAVKVNNGFLVLINSGLMVLIKQSCQVIYTTGFDQPEGSDDEVALLAGAIHSYIRFDDPMFGPLPMSGDFGGIMANRLTRACEKFVVAHEYGHILAGHFDGNNLTNISLPSATVAVSVIKKQWESEFEADRIAFELLLGGSTLSQAQRQIFDGLESTNDSRVIARAIDVQSALAAPVFFLALAEVVGRVRRALTNTPEKAEEFFTHPPPLIRSARCLQTVLSQNLPSTATILLGLVHKLGTMTERIIDVVKEIQAGRSPFSQGMHPSDFRRWFSESDVTGVSDDSSKSEHC